MSWKHPTGEQPKRISFVALGPTRNQWANAMQNHNEYFIEGIDEVWTCNAGGYWLRHDLLFVMDNIVGEAMKWPQYGRFLARHDKPIITSDNYEPIVPHAYPYPLTEIRKMVGDSNWYWHNSVPYILAYALYIGVEEITLWGCDYNYPDLARREENRANAEYWIGYCRAKGMTVGIPDKSTLCNTNRGRWFYGYALQPLRMPEEPTEEPALSLVTGRPVGSSEL